MERPDQLVFELLPVSVGGAAAQQLAEADAVGWASGASCLARRSAVEWMRNCPRPPSGLA